MGAMRWGAVLVVAVVTSICLCMAQGPAPRGVPCGPDGNCTTGTCVNGTCRFAGMPEIVIDRQLSDPTPGISEVVTVTTFVHNVGTGYAVNVVVMEVIPPEFLFVRGEKSFTGTIPANHTVSFTYDMRAPGSPVITRFPSIKTLYFDTLANKYVKNFTGRPVGVMAVDRESDIAVTWSLDGEIVLLRGPNLNVSAIGDDMVVVKTVSDPTPVLGDIIEVNVRVTNNLDHDVQVTCLEPMNEMLKFIQLNDTLRTLTVRENGTAEYTYEMEAVRLGVATLEVTHVLLEEHSVKGQSRTVSSKEFRSNQVDVKVLDSKWGGPTVTGPVTITTTVVNVGNGNVTNATLSIPVGDDYVEGAMFGDAFTWRGDLAPGGSTTVNLSLTPRHPGTFELLPASISYTDADQVQHETWPDGTLTFHAAHPNSTLIPKVELFGFLDRNEYRGHSWIMLHAVVMNHGKDAAINLGLNLTGDIKCNGSCPWTNQGWPSRRRCRTSCTRTVNVPGGEVRHATFSLEHNATSTPPRITLTARYSDSVGNVYATRSFPLEVPLFPPGPDKTGFTLDMRYSQEDELLTYKSTAQRQNLTTRLVYMFTPPKNMDLATKDGLELDDGTLLIRSFDRLDNVEYTGLKDSMTRQIDFPESRTDVYFVDLDGIAHSYVMESVNVQYQAKQQVYPTPYPYNRPVCGNGICERWESGSNCCTDCGCSSDEVCVNERCRLDIGKGLGSILVALALAVLAYALAMLIMRNVTLEE